MDTISLLQLVTVKICHDLAGPAGAVNNGVEIFSESTEEMQEKSFELIETSAKDMITRLMIFRRAFGSASKHSESDLLSFQKIIADYTTPKKVHVHWQHEQDFIQLNNELLQITTNLILIACDILITGGKLNIRITNSNNNISIRVVGTSPQFKMIPALQQLFGNETPTEECTSRNVMCFYLHRLLESTTFQLDVKENQQQFELILT